MKAKAMKTQVDKRVKSDLNPHLLFSPEYIDSFQVKSLYDDKFENCEYWDEDDNEGLAYSFGRIGYGTDVNIFKNSTKFFSGEGITVGFLKTKPLDLFLVKEAHINNNDIAILNTWFNVEYEVKHAPATVLNFAMMIGCYLLHFDAAFADYKMNYVLQVLEDERQYERDRKEFEKGNFKGAPIEDDLPF